MYESFKCFLPSFKSISLFGSGDVKKRFSRWRPWPPSWISDWNNFSYFRSTSHPDAFYQVSSQLARGCRKSRLVTYFLTPHDPVSNLTDILSRTSLWESLKLIRLKTWPVECSQAILIIKGTQLCHCWSDLTHFQIHPRFYVSLLSASFLKIQQTRGPRVMTHSPEWNSYCICRCYATFFPILSLQLLKRSSFEQVLVLKKKKVCFFYHHYFIINRHDSQWSVTIWTNSPSCFNSRIDMKLDGNWQTDFCLTISCIYTCIQHRCKGR